MSIVKGTSGFLDISSDLVPTGTYTIATWIKTTNPSEFGNYLYYENDTTSGAAVRLDVWNGTIRHRSEQQFTAEASDPTGAGTGTWEVVIGSNTAGAPSPRLVTDNGAFDAGGSSGTYATPNSPAMRIFGRTDGGNQPNTGAKIGMIAIYTTEIDATDESHLTGGGDPTALPSATAPTYLWIDSTGIVKDGSDNLTSWTDQIASAVLTPSGTVTVDDADLAPVTYGSSDSQITSKTLERLGASISATTAAVYVWAGHDVNLSSTPAAFIDLSVSVSSGVMSAVSLASTTISPTDDITVVVLPDSVDPGIVIETQAEAL